MKKIMLAGALALAPLAGTAGSLGPFSDLLVFGDSLSDPGNAFAAFGAAAADPNIYPNGQFTNGDTWATTLGADLASGTNFAFGGAKASTDNDLSPDFAAQRASYFASGVSLGDTPLTAVFFGGNDVRNAAPADLPGIVAGAVTDIATGVAELAASGLNDFLVFGLPSLSNLPDIINTPAEGPARMLTEDFNTALQSALAPLSALANIQYFDTAAWFDDFIETAEADGRIIDEACLEMFPACNALNANSHVNYDGLHPTEFVHDALAQAVTAAVVPLPAGFLLLLTGAGALAMVRSRKA